MPTKPSAEDVSKSGITTDSAGQRHIPSSVRADGSVRKEIKVRPGYRPPEDVEVYKNRTAEAFRNRGKAPPPGAEARDSEDKDGTEAGSAASKNAKRREARKRAAAATTSGEKADGKSAAAKEEDTTSKAPAEEVPVDAEAEKEKEAKKLSKKLRQARDLKERKEKGDALLPEQFEKVIRINELIRQLDALGFDAEGGKKASP